jgi:hypothetical protein
VATTRHSPSAILEVLTRHQVDFIVVGGVAAALHGVPLTTFDLDLVHSRNAPNLRRLLDALTDLECRFREKSGSKPVLSHLDSPGHLLLMTKHGPLDLLGTIGKGRGYDDMIGSCVGSCVDTSVGTMSVQVLGLEELIAVKQETGREKDPLALPVLGRTLEERRRRERPG